MTSRAALREWREACIEEGDCPYVGPRPQTVGRDVPEMLIGRDGDLERINYAVHKRPLVVLDGYSGVGKTSLLQNGLNERLERAGFAVLVSRKWGEIPLDQKAWSEKRIEGYVAGRIMRTHQEAKLRLKAPAGSQEAPALQTLCDGTLCSQLDEAYKQTGAVLILDQFEELLRQHKEFADKVVKWIIAIGYRHKTRVVISLRTDSLHLLDPVLRGVKPFSMDRVNVGEIKDDEAIRDVIKTQRDRRTACPPDTEAARPPIAADAVERLVGLWRDQPRLLDLQATLWALYFRARCRQEGAAGAQIELTDVLALEAEARQAGLAPLTFQFRESISLRIRHAEAAAKSVGLDEYLVSGTREAVRRAAPFLSLGDFKVPIHQFELARLTLARELQVLERALRDEWKQEKDPVESLFEELRKYGDRDDDVEQPARRDLLTVGWWEIPRLKEISVALAQSRGTDALRRVEVGAGPMMSQPASATLFEEIRRVAFAIEWLTFADIAKKDDDGTLLLVHDGSGGALKAWAKTHTAGPERALLQLTAARGEHYVWLHDEIGGDSHEVIANVNWRECRISTEFRNVVFVNCDFSGSRFDDCSFQGVTFVNCLLDDANFERCRIRGFNTHKRITREKWADEAFENPGPERRARTSTGTIRVAPSFTVAAEAKEVSSYCLYCEGESGEEPRALKAQFFSDTSGIPAWVGSPGRDYSGEVIAHFDTSGSHGEGANGQVPVRVPTSGGVVMVGGRLCFLTVYRCMSEDNGSLAFHHVSGGGLDIVEQYGGSVDIHDGVIRGISVSRDEDPSAERSASVELKVKDSMIAHVYLSGAVTGSAAFENSIVLMLINASDGITIDIENCRYHSLVNTRNPHNSIEDSETGEKRYFEPVSGSRFEAVRNRLGLAGDLMAMDFRLHPDLWERDQRLRWAKKNAKPPKEKG